MNKQTIKQAKKQLVQHRQEIIDSTSTPRDMSIDLEGDEIDEIQGKIIANITAQISAREKERLIRIERALQKIKDGSFGSCEDCCELIAEKRLIAYPEFFLCLSCSEDRERSK